MHDTVFGCTVTVLHMECKLYLFKKKQKNIKVRLVLNLIMVNTVPTPFPLCALFLHSLLLNQAEFEFIKGCCVVLCLTYLSFHCSAYCNFTDKVKAVFDPGLYKWRTFILSSVPTGDLQVSFVWEFELLIMTFFSSIWFLFSHVLGSEDQAMVYTAEIVSAVSHLHKSGIVHRDLKPENILMDADGHVIAMPIYSILLQEYEWKS